MSEAFVLSDIHGELEKLMSVLKNWNPETQKLIVLGDLVDRGPDSFEVVQYVYRLQAHSPKGKVVVIKGNHEDLFDRYVRYGEPAFIWNGGQATIDSFIRGSKNEYQDFFLGLSTRDQVLKLKSEFEQLFNWLFRLPLYHQEGKFLFTHAGYSQELTNWFDSEQEDFIWTRNHWEFQNRTGLINVFGHTPVVNIHGIHDPYVDMEEGYIGIDGGSCFGGQINGLLVNLEEGKILEVYKSE